MEAGLDALTFSETLVAVFFANGVTAALIWGLFAMRRDERKIGPQVAVLICAVVICLAGIASVQAGG